MAFNLNDYETVEDRLARFWVDHPAGRITTAMMNYDGDSCVFRAEIYFDAIQSEPTATGYAEEIRGSSPVNKTAFVENCETSAIGRGLANCGYATHGKRPSREEMGKVSRLDGVNLATRSEHLAGKTDRITTIGGLRNASDAQIGLIKRLGKQLSMDEQALFGFIQIELQDDSKVLEMLTIAEASQVIGALKAQTA